MAQLTAYLGRLPEVLPPKFALGYHICRQTLDDSARLTVDLEAMKAAGIPFDGDCISQGLMSTAFQTEEDENGGNFEANYQNLSRAGKKFFWAQPPHVDVNLASSPSSDDGDSTFLKVGQGEDANYIAQFKGNTA